MLNGLGGWHWIVILLIVLLLFGAPKLPALARSIGQSMRIFRSEVKTKPEGESTDGTTNGTATGTGSTSSTADSGDTTSKP